MKKINVRFECDPALEGIEVIIRAREQDGTVKELMQKLNGCPADMFAVFDEYGNFRSIRAGEIISASVSGKLVSLLTADGSWYTRQTLQNLESALSGERFVRISRFELINLDQVVRYDFTIAGTLRIELNGGTETWASRRCIPAIRRKLTGKE